MKIFIASFDYASKLADGSREYVPPFFFEAPNDDDAHQIVEIIANFAALTISPDIHVQYAETGGVAKEVFRSAPH